MEENRAENQTPRRQHTQHPTHQAHKKKKSGTHGDSTTEAGKVGNRPYARGRAYREDHYDE